MGGKLMKKIALMLLVLVCLTGTAMAGEKFSLDAGVDYSSRYIWRGMDLIEDNQAAVQPWFSTGYAVTDKLTVSYLFWADYRLIEGDDKANRDNDWDEFDHVISMNYAFNDNVSFDLGYIYYCLPDGAWVSGTNNDQEVYGGVNVALADNLSTNVTVYYNFDRGSADGIYAKWSLDASKALTDTAEFSASAGIGYMDYDNGINGFADLPLSTRVSVDLGHGLGMYVSANYSFAFEAVRDNGADYENEAWVMTGLSYSM